MEKIAEFLKPDTTSAEHIYFFLWIEDFEDYDEDEDKESILDEDTDGRGHEKGSGKGSGKGCSDGYGKSWSHGNKCCSYDDGHGYGSGRGSGWGHVDSYGEGYGDGKGKSWRYGKGDGIKSINNHKIYRIDDINTIIYSVRNNVAKGAILDDDLTLSPCYIIRQDCVFKHGPTLKEAKKSLLYELFYSQVDKLDHFKNLFPEIDGEYNAKDLHDWYYILTGTYSFISDKSINMNKKYTVREFIEYTKKIPQKWEGKENIKQLEKMY
jgi:hypothetical protein